MLRVPTNVIPIRPDVAVRPAGDATASDYFGELRDAQAQATRWQLLALGLGAWLAVKLYEDAKRKAR